MEGGEAQGTDDGLGGGTSADALGQSDDSAPATKVFPIYDTVKDDGAPLTLHAMAERGRGNDIIRTVDRELDVNINEKDRYGRTPLHWAAEHGHKITAEILIDLGAEVRATENLGRTPIHLAARSTHCELLQSLLEGMEEDERKQVVNMQDNRGITALFLASQKGQEGEACFSYLLQCGAIYNKQDSMMPRKNLSK